MQLTKLKTMNISMVLLEAQPLLRIGLKSVVNETQIASIIGEAADFITGMKIVHSNTPTPDIVLIGTSIEGATELEIVNYLKKTKCKIIILGRTDDVSVVKTFLESGVNSYILNTSDLVVFKEAILSTHETGFFVDPKIVKKMFVNKLGDELQEHLTNVELRVLGLLGQGMTNQEISKHLFVSVSTVKTHLSNMFKKLGCSHRVGLVLEAQKMGYISINSQISYLPEREEELRAVA